MIGIISDIATEHFLHLSDTLMNKYDIIFVYKTLRYVDILHTMYTHGDVTLKNVQRR